MTTAFFVYLAIALLLFLWKVNAFANDQKTIDEARSFGTSDATIAMVSIVCASVFGLLWPVNVVLYARYRWKRWQEQRRAARLQKAMLLLRSLLLGDDAPAAAAPHEVRLRSTEVLVHCGCGCGSDGAHIGAPLAHRAGRPEEIRTGLPGDEDHE